MAQVTVSVNTIDLRKAEQQLVRGSHVDNLQGLLNGTRKSEFAVGEIDGLGGPKTKQAVVAFQGANGLAQDAIVGPRTWTALIQH